jgi:phosphopantothenoylcysteine decarboxylase/phosphopantothenate--cysteine ligase
MPLALVTCGPAYEPLDAVRRITNHSTGELGTVLCETLHAAGFRTICLRGDMATHPAPSSAGVIPFSTNTSLAGELEKIPENPAVIFHAAALCDYALTRIEGTKGEKKIRSNVAELVLTLHPAEKILPRLRPLFPDALIVGWKYELDGTRDDAVQHAHSQITHAVTDACVINGSAYGNGFGFLENGSNAIPHFSSKTDLASFLTRWALEELSSR